MKFKIEYLCSVEGTALVMARQLESGDFALSSSARLGGVPLQQLLEIPRKLIRPGGLLDTSVMVFALSNSADSSRLSKGDVVELIP